MIDCRFKPLTHWPRGETTDRRWANFRSSYPQTLDLLEAELDKLDATSIIVEVDIRPEDIRNDGWPRANARVPNFPGVIVSFSSRHGPLSYACDTFTAWIDNLRAIAKTLENLRAVERYGATKHGEQYRGYAQIESADASQIGFSTVDGAAIWLKQASGIEVTEAILLTSQFWLKRAYLKAAAKLHPDAGGDEESFKRLGRAKEMLEKHQSEGGRE